jgi:signal transduction histidine kinase/CheY-like chemotaxis protein
MQQAARRDQNNSLGSPVKFDVLRHASGHDDLSAKPLKSPGARWLALLSQSGAGLGGLIGTVVLGGYVLHVPALVTLRPGLKGMSPLTALGLLAIALAVLAWSRGARPKAQIAAAIAIAITIAALISHLFMGQDAISPILAQTLFQFPANLSGRTSIATAIGIGLVGISIFLRSREAALADMAAGAALIIAGTALLGYAYGVSDLYALPMFNSMALHTAFVLFLLSGTALLADPNSGWASILASNSNGGHSTRRQLLFLMAPPIAGWVLLSWTNAHLIGLGAAMALLVVATVVPLALLILRDGRVLETLDRERRAKADLLTGNAIELEAKLAAQAEALAHESNERTKAEAVLYRAQRMEAVGQLTGGIAHDFNNLLMAIGGNLELLKQRLPADDPKIQRYLSHATAAAEKGAKVTSQLLAFSRSQRLDIRAVSLDPILANARALIGNSLGPKIDVQMDLRSAGTWVRTDPGQLELAILNLAINARDAMPEGGTLRIVSHVIPTEAAGHEGSPDDIIIQVTDTGGGMTEEVAAKAVEPFFTTKSRGKGTGLGLAQVYGFARQCGGDLNIISAPGEGTTIEIVLKSTEALDHPVAPASTAHMSAVADQYEKPLLLVIDDDESVRAVVVDALLGAGFRVEQASDGPAGLAILERCKPAAAVIDFLMPGMNGAEVARLAQIRQPGLPIVFVSGYSETVALDEIAGAVVLRKPFQMDALSRTVNSVLQ